jgi:hypothetical protein
VELVWLIQQFYAAGLSSKSILTILPCVETHETTPEALAVLVTERERLDRRLADLARARKQLDDVIAIASSGACSHGSLPA